MEKSSPRQKAPHAPPAMAKLESAKLLPSKLMRLETVAAAAQPLRALPVNYPECISTSAL
jgi:hypothetical protein